jgi:hypothetical protein
VRGEAPVQFWRTVRLTVITGDVNDVNDVNDVQHVLVILPTLENAPVNRLLQPGRQ